MSDDTAIPEQGSLNVGVATDPEVTASLPPVEPPRGGSSIRLVVQRPERLSRGLLFVKWLLVVPAFVVVALYGIAVFVTTFLAFWAILLTGRYPPELFNFSRSYMGMYARTVAYFPLLLTDQYPLSEKRLRASEAAVWYEVDHPEGLSRFRLLLKLLTFLLYVVFLLTTLPILLMVVAAIPAWFAILFTGRYPAGLFRFVVSLMQWTARVVGWQYLMRDEWSLFGDTRKVSIPVGVGALLSVGLGALLWIGSLTAESESNAFAVGDCFNFTVRNGQVVSQTLTSCRTGHDAEVYAEVKSSAGVGAPYPGGQALFQEVQPTCLSAFEGFVGTSYDESALDILILGPNAKEWNGLGARRLTCSVYRMDLAKLRGTARASGL